MNTTTIKIALLIIGGVLFGLVQEMIKVNINSTIQMGDSVSGYYNLSQTEKFELINKRGQQKSYDYYYSHSKIKALTRLNRKQLVILKWSLTLVFLIVNFMFCYIILKHLLPSQNSAIKLLLYMYAIGLSLGLVFFGVGKIVNHDFYPFSRKIVGFLQTLLPVVLIYIHHLIPRNEA